MKDENPKSRSWMMWCANTIHLWWGLLFLHVGSVHPGFGGTRLFSDSAQYITAFEWGVSMSVTTLMSVTGMFMSSKPLGAILVIPQQLIIMAACVHALELMAAHWPISTRTDEVVWLAGAYVVSISVFHSIAVVEHHIVREVR